MRAYDFRFDEKNLSDFGMIICNFGSKGMETISNGSNIVFNTVSTLGGTNHKLISTEYEDCLQTTIQICKNSCTGKSMEISSTEFRKLTKWLNRKKFLKFKILNKDYMDLYFEASFNISRIEFNGSLYGLELTIITNAPFAYKEPRIITIKNLINNGTHSVNDTSHEEGYIYPYTEITVNANGKLEIYNAIEDRHTVINNCVSGEVITMDYPVIYSSITSHEIQNDFNWNFFRISNTYDFSRNDLTISIPCTIKLEYSPIVKVGL